VDRGILSLFLSFIDADEAVRTEPVFVSRIVFLSFHGIIADITVHRTVRHYAIRVRLVKTVEQAFKYQSCLSPGRNGLGVWAAGAGLRMAVGGGPDGEVTNITMLYV
jgi:hypothetical protein